MRRRGGETRAGRMDGASGSGGRRPDLAEPDQQHAEAGGPADGANPVAVDEMGKDGGVGAALYKGLVEGYLDKSGGSPEYADQGGGAPGERLVAMQRQHGQGEAQFGQHGGGDDPSDAAHFGGVVSGKLGGADRGEQGIEDPLHDPDEPAEEGTKHDLRQNKGTGRATHTG